MFGAIYKNTQLLLLEDTLISIGLSLLYPFVIYLIPGFFRIPVYLIQKKREKIYINLVSFYRCFNNNYYQDPLK